MFNSGDPSINSSGDDGGVSSELIGDSCRTPPGSPPGPERVQNVQLSCYRHTVAKLYQPLNITVGKALYNGASHQPRLGYYYLQSILTGFAGSFNRLWPVFLLAAQAYDAVLYGKQKALLSDLTWGNVLSGMHVQRGFVMANNEVNSYNSVIYPLKFYLLFAPFTTAAVINLLRWAIAQSSGESLNLFPKQQVVSGMLPLTSQDMQRKKQFMSLVKERQALLNVAEDSQAAGDGLQPLLHAEENINNPENLLFLLLGTSRLFELAWLNQLNPDKEYATLEQRINHISEDSNRLVKIYSQYLKWRLGLSNSNKDNCFHIYGLFHLYCKLQWLRLAYDAWVTAPNNYAQAHNDCQQEQGKKWTYQPLLANYDCSRCGDWNFIAVNANDDAAICFSKLMQQTMDASSLTSKINQLAAKEMITHCDLTRVDFESMTETDLKQLLEALKGLRWNQTHFSCHWQPQLISKVQWSLWLDLWRVMRPRSLSVQSMPLDVTHIQSLQQENFWESLEDIAIIGCQLDNLAAKQLLAHLPAHLLSLNISHNSISAAFLPDFYRAKTDTLQYLDFSHNHMQMDWSDLTQLLLRARSELVLDFNRGVRAGIVNTTLSQQITTKKLSLQACHLDVSSIASLSQLLSVTTISDLSIADNLLGEEASALLNTVTLPHLIRLNYSGNNDIHHHFGMKGNVSVWPNLKALDLSRMQWSQHELHALNHFFSSCRTLALTMQHAYLNDQNLLTLLNQTKPIFYGIDLGFNQLTNDSMSLITSALQQPAQFLRLQHMQGVITQQHALANVSRIDFSYTELSEQQLTSLVAPESVVKQLTLTDTSNINHMVRTAINSHLPSNLDDAKWIYCSEQLNPWQAGVLLKVTPESGLTTLYYSAAVDDTIRASACRLQSRSHQIDYSFKQDPTWQMRTCTSAASLNSPGQLLILLVLANTLMQLFANSRSQLSSIFYTTRMPNEKQDAQPDHPEATRHTV